MLSQRDVLTDGLCPGVHLGLRSFVPLLPHALPGFGHAPSVCAVCAVCAGSYEDAGYEKSDLRKVRGGHAPWISAHAHETPARGNR